MGLYRPLRQGAMIRLLKLSQHSLTTDSPLEMTEYSLDDGTVPNFFGLSYCWGSPNRSQTLLVSHASVQISVNLRRGLDELAALEEFDGAYFWIDQICVNQDDLAERSHQVTLMKRVYQTASRTVIWLSSPLGLSGIPEPHDHGWQLAETLHIFGQSRSDWTRRIPFLKAPYPLERAIHSSTFPSLGLPEATDGAWQELKSILCNPWFSRMWVLQEATLSSVPATIVYAGRTHSLEHVLWAGAWLWQAEGPRVELEFPQSALSNVHAMFIIALSAIPWRIEPLLMGTDKLEVSDLRDKVIGLLGLVAPESMPRSWAPDYHCEVVEVYRDVTRAIIEETGKLLIFEGINYQCGSQYDTPSGLPSWTPRIHDVWPPVAATRLGQDDVGSAAQLWLEGFRACRGRHAQMLKESNPDILPLRGLELDQVGWVSPVLKEEGGEEYRLLRWVEEGMRRFCSDGRESTGAFVNRFFQAVARAKYFPEAATVADLQDYIRHHGEHIPNRHALDQLLGTAGTECIGKHDAENLGTMERNMRTISNFFVTKQGNIGFGPRWIALGDFVVVLYGFEAPFVLRLRGDNYILLGSSYVPGFMDGEAIDLLENGKIEESWFRLC